tara:strand:+ start:131 stop:592 length:462 start_codon:yes stop_codon:yes gene_type:complete
MVHNSQEERKNNPGNRSKGGGRKGPKKEKRIAVDKYSSKKDKVKFDESKIKEHHIYLIYNEIRFIDKNKSEEGFKINQLDLLYSQVKSAANFCKINSQERYQMIRGGIESYYVHIAKGGIVSIPINDSGKVTKTNRLEYLLPNVQAYNPLVDN